MKNKFISFLLAAVMSVSMVIPVQAAGFSDVSTKSWAYPAIEKLLILGRVTSGKGGDIILQEAGDVIRKEFPEYKVEFAIPDEKNRRHGQAVAAASLPMI